MHRSRLLQVPFALVALAILPSALFAVVTPLVPTFTPTGAVSLTYQLPASPGASTAVSLATAAVAVAPAASTFYTIDAGSIPFWLSVPEPLTGTVVSPITAGAVAGTPSVFHLVASSQAAFLGPGTYTGTVTVSVLGFAPLSIPVSLLVKAPSSALSVRQGNSVLSALTWSVGAAQPAFTFTLATDNQPISYTTTLSTLTSTGTTVASGISITPTSGIVFSGSTLSVSLSALVYAKAVAGDVLTATVTINYASTTIPLSFSLTVLPPVAAITSLYPAATPVDTAAADVVNVVITGTGFVPTGTGQITQVFANGAEILTGTGLVVTVVNSTTITLAITVGTTAHYFDTAGTPMTLAVINPNGGSPAAPTSGPAFANLNVVSTPIINAVSSASTYIQLGASAQFAPYDLISIFGTNFCPDCGNGNPALLTGAGDATYFRYPTSLSPDTGASQHYLQVAFNKHGGAFVGFGYLLFANNTQINVLVPSALALATPTLIGTGTIDIVVSYGTTAPPTTPISAENSTAYVAGLIATDPGVLTVNSNGVGQGAILNGPDFSLNSSTNALTHGTGTAIIYMTGLGAPTSTASNATTSTTMAYPGSCISALGATSPSVIIGYLTTMNTTTSSPVYTAPTSPWTSLDGAVIQSAKIVANGTFHLPPCISPVTATIAGASATVTYAGWVADSVAGLYQVNLTVPSSAATGSAVSVPVLVTVGGKTSQTGVTLWAK